MSSRKQGKSGMNLLDSDSEETVQVNNNDPSIPGIGIPMNQSQQKQIAFGTKPTSFQIAAKDHIIAARSVRPYTTAKEYGIN